MSLLPTHMSLGQLTMLEVYEFYDFPQLFSCRNTAGDIFLAVHIDHSDLDDVWLYAPMSPARFADVRSGAVDLHDAYAQAEHNAVYHVTIPRHVGTSHVESLSCTSLTDDMLPLVGERLEMGDEPLPVVGGMNAGDGGVEPQRKAG